VALDLELPADQRVDAAFLGELVQVGGVLLERGGALAVALALGLRAFVATLLALVTRLGEPVRDEVDDVEARDVLQREQVGGVGVLLTEDRHQHVRDRHLFLAARLHVEHRALQHALEASVAVPRARRPALRRGVVWSMNSASSLRRRVHRPARAQDLRTLGVSMIASSRCSTVMNFVAGLPRRLEGLVKADLEFAAQHVFRPLPSCREVGAGAAGVGGHLRTLVSAIS